MISNIPAIGQQLHDAVLNPMKASFVGKDEIIDLMGVCLVGGENLFILGPPGTAKSALVHELGRRLDGTTFEYLLTRFTEPNELFGPFDIRKLREGILETNVEGMLPEASFVFLDELLNANSAILNSILTVLNERVLRRGREIYRLPLLMVIGASNHLPEEEALQALFDRFLLRVQSDNVHQDDLAKVLEAGWQREANHREPISGSITADDVRSLQQHVLEIDLTPVRSRYLDLISRIRKVGLTLSDRRAVKLQRLIAASALLCGRPQAQPSDLWILRYIWDRKEQQEVLRALVDESLTETTEVFTKEHPRGTSPSAPNPELIASDLSQLAEAFQKANQDDPSRLHQLQDRLSALAARSEWIENEEQRNALKEQIASLWETLEVPQQT